MQECNQRKTPRSIRFITAQGRIPHIWRTAANIVLRYVASSLERDIASAVGARGLKFFIVRECELANEYAFATVLPFILSPALVEYFFSDERRICSVEMSSSRKENGSESCVRKVKFVERRKRFHTLMISLPLIFSSQNWFGGGRYKVRGRK